MAPSTRSSLRGQRRYSTATPVFARAATDSIVSLAKPASTSSAHAASSSAASSSSPRRRCRGCCACSVTPTSIEPENKRCLHPLIRWPTLIRDASISYGKRRAIATTPTSPAKPPVEKLDPKVVKTALILIVGGMAVIFDTTIVSVALRVLAVKLDTSVATIQWVTTGYLLALAIAVPLSAWGLKRFGGKRLWMFSLAVFLIGSIGSSLAWNVGSLIGWRVVQGAGGGLMLPLMTTLIFQAAGGKSLGRLVTYVALPALLGPILGPLVGGAILTHLSWRFLFWVNAPFCVAGLLLAWRYLCGDAPAPSGAAPRLGLDLPGLFLLAPGTVAILLVLDNAGTSAGFGHADVVVPLVIGVGMLAAFAGYALRAS